MGEKTFIVCELNFMIRELQMIVAFYSSLYN